MTKLVSIKDFHFDKEKSGQILNAWRVEKDMSIPELAAESGIPENTLKNSLYGKVQDLTMDRTFKICVALGHCPCEYIEAMLKDEPIDFADKIHVLRDPTQVKVPMFPAAQKARAEDNASIPDGILDRFRRIYDNTIVQLKEQIAQLKESREIMQTQYQQQLDTMERQHRVHNEALELRHKETIELAGKEIDHLNKQISRLRLALVIETSAIGILFFVDSLISDRGWILRSLFDFGSGNGFSIKG